MGTRIHVSGLSYFCTDDKLRQAFTPFGTVVLAQVVRDEWGHSLGLGDRAHGLFRGRRAGLQ